MSQHSSDNFNSIEEILDVRVRGNIKQYLVKWKGRSTPIWESSWNIECTRLIGDYENRSESNNVKPENSAEKTYESPNKRPRQI